jgi:acid stress-induced BolA-like protein IbaG/YrbA
MKLNEKFEKLLKKSFTKTIILDKNGDGHFVTIICIDDCFLKMSRLEKSRYAFKKLENLIKQVHSITVQCYSVLEWEKSEKTEFLKNKSFIEV